MEFRQDVNQALLSNGVNKIVVQKQATKTTSTQPLLGFADILLSIFVVCPLVVVTWRGAWGLMDLYSGYFPAIPSIVVGMGIHIALAMWQDSLHKVIVEAQKHWILKMLSHVLRRFYTYIFFIVTILHWRGGWILIDHYTNVHFVVKKEQSVAVLIILALSFFLLVMCRSLRSATAPPFTICLDKGSFIFRFPTMYEKKTKNNAMLYLLDCMYSVCIMGNLVIAFWRGLWTVVDICIFPNNYIMSSWMSALLGLILIGVVFRLQNCMKKVCTRCSGVTKFFLADFYIMLSIFSTLLYWRGLWNSLNIYFLPDDVELSYQLNNIFGFMILIILGCSNSLLVRGIYNDGKEQNGVCVVFPCEYLQIILEQENADNQIVDDVQVQEFLENKV